MIDDFLTDGPSLDDLAAIEAEWPKIQAGLDDLDAEIRALYGIGVGLSELDRRRKRRTEARLTRTATRTIVPVIALRVAA